MQYSAKEEVEQIKQALLTCFILRCYTFAWSVHTQERFMHTCFLCAVSVPSTSASLDRIETVIWRPWIYEHIYNKSSSIFIAQVCRMPELAVMKSLTCRPKHSIQFPFLSCSVAKAHYSKSLNHFIAIYNFMACHSNTQGMTAWNPTLYTHDLSSNENQWEMNQTM